MLTVFVHGSIHEHKRSLDLALYFLFLNIQGIDHECSIFAPLKFGWLLKRRPYPNVEASLPNNLLTRQIFLLYVLIMSTL